MLTLIKLGHTVVWAVLVGCTLGIFVFAHDGRFVPASVLIAIVMGEVIVLAYNEMRCPLTDVAARYTTDRAENFDIYLPRWLARSYLWKYGS